MCVYRNAEVIAVHNINMVLLEVVCYLLYMTCSVAMLQYTLHKHTVSLLHRTEQSIITGDTTANTAANAAAVAVLL
jgi:hypothetical protein